MALDTSASALAIAVDIGGTFTDIALVDHATGQAWRAKTPSTPADPSEGFLNGIRLALSDAGGPRPTWLRCFTAPRWRRT